MQTFISSALLIVLTWFSSPAQAVSEAECTKIIDRVGVINVHRRWTGTDCYLSVSPYRGPGLVYRNFLITAEGQFMVFNSYGDGDASTDTGARVYYMFPRGVTPSVAVVDGQLVAQWATNGVKISFMTDKGNIAGFSAGQVAEDKEVVPGNQGGVELTNSGVLMMDVGYKTGDTPVSNPNRKAIFYDGFGKTCQVANKELFRYFSDGDADFRFTDIELKAFLGKKCPQLKLTF